MRERNMCLTITINESELKGYLERLRSFKISEQSLEKLKSSVPDDVFDKLEEFKKPVGEEEFVNKLREIGIKSKDIVELILEHAN